MARNIFLFIDADRCRTCQICLAARSCKVLAIIRIDADEAPVLDASRCYDCRVCIPACPFEAISIAALIR